MTYLAPKAVHNIYAQKVKLEGKRYRRRSVAKQTYDTLFSMFFSHKHRNDIDTQTSACHK